MTRKCQKRFHWTLIVFRMIKIISRNGPFHWKPKAYLIWVGWFWSQVRVCISNTIFFWPFGYRATHTRQEIWGLTEIEAVKGWSHVLIQLKGWVVDNWPISNKEPPPPWLKLCQISNFLTQKASLVSQWPEKVEKLSIEHYLASEPSKPFSEKPLFSDIIQHIWLCFDESEAL